MNEVDREKLRNLATVFREAIERAKTCDDPRITWLKRFPKDCCDLVSTFLSLFLFGHGIRDFRKVSADFPCKDTRKRTVTHVWLEVDDVIIDITADQFETVEERIIAREISQFHESLVNRRQYALDIEDDSEQHYFERISSLFFIEECYRAIVEHVDMTRLRMP